MHHPTRGTRVGARDHRDDGNLGIALVAAAAAVLALVSVVMIIVGSPTDARVFLIVGVLAVVVMARVWWITR